MNLQKKRIIPILMSEQTKSRKIHNLLKYGFLLLAALVLLLQMFNFKSSMLKSSITYLRHLPPIVESATYWFIPMVFGAVYSKRKLRFNEGFILSSLSPSHGT